MASGVLRSSPDPFGSMSVKTPPVGHVFRQNAFGCRHFIRASLALIKRLPLGAFCLKMPPGGGIFIDRDPKGCRVLLSTPEATKGFS